MSTYETTNTASLALTEQYLYGSSRLGVLDSKGRSYELTDHLGNVRAVVDEAKTVSSTTDYYPFGMTANAYTPNGYRYGFNGKEKDTEGMGGGGSTYDYGFRIYNPALGKFLSVDPLFESYPWNSAFMFAEYNPIRFLDLDGLEKANPDMFDLAIVMINKFRDEIIKVKNLDKTFVKGVTMTDVLNDLEKQLNAAKVAGYSDVKTNELGYYCGKSATHNDIILYNPIGYSSLITDLFTKGEAQFGGDGAKLSIPSNLQSGGCSSGLSPVEEVFGKTLNSSTKNKSIVRNIVKAVSSSLSNEGNSVLHEYKRILKAIGMKLLQGSSSFAQKEKR